MSNPARFLSRWSRLKRQAVADASPAPAVAADPHAALPESGAGVNDAPFSSSVDLTALLREELSDAVRKQTLKAIFADPHFNVMDGLDTYIDDYSISEPIPLEMMATLNQARFLFGTDEEAGEQSPAAGDGKVLVEGVALEEGRGDENCDNLPLCGQEVPVSPFAELSSKDK